VEEVLATSLQSATSADQYYRFQESYRRGELQQPLAITRTPSQVFYMWLLPLVSEIWKEKLSKLSWQN